MEAEERKKQLAHTFVAASLEVVFSFFFFLPLQTSAKSFFLILLLILVESAGRFSSASSFVFKLYKLLEGEECRKAPESG